MKRRATLMACLVLAGGLSLESLMTPTQTFAGESDFVGQKIEAFKLPTLTDSEGKQKEISSDAFKGKVVVMSFWASWCGPCRRELPAYNQVYSDLKDKGLEIVAINVDRDEADAKAFLGKIDPLTYPVLLDSKSVVMGRYDIVSMPTSFIIGRDGTILHRETGFSDEKLAEMKTKLEAALAAK